jgi:hypothetical protein
MHVEVLLGRHGMAGRVAALDSHLAAEGAPLSARWLAVDTWLRHHPRCEPCAVLVSAGAEVVAGTMFWRAHRFGTWKVGTAAAAGEPTWLYARDPSAADLLAQAVVAELTSDRRPWMLHLADVGESSAALAALARRLPCAVVTEGSVAPQLIVDHQSALNTHVTRNTRSAVAKARNRIAADGLKSELTWTSDPIEIADALPEIVELHRDRNRQVRGRAGFDDPAEVALFVDMAQAHADAGRAHVARLRIDSQLASFAVCFLGERGALWVYANLVSPKFTHYSAGTIVNADVVRYAWENPDMHSVDWGAGVQRYKLSGPVVLRRSHHLFAWSSRSIRTMWHLRHRSSEMQTALTT